MNGNADARRLRVTVAIAMVAMVTGLATAASGYGRNVAAGGRPAWVAWKRSRGIADQTAINRAMLYDDKYRGEEDHLLYPNDDEDDDDDYPRRSQFPDPLRGRNGPFGGQPLGRNSPQSKPYLVRPVRRKRRRQEGKTPDRSPDYVAPFVRSLRRWDEENPVDAGRPVTTFGSRKIVRTPPRERGWRRPMEELWKRLHSSDDSAGNDLEAPKRQPPPGFHAIRGKRNSESENETYSVADNETETENETETGEENSIGRLAAARGDSFNASF